MKIVLKIVFFIEGNRNPFFFTISFWINTFCYGSHDNIGQGFHLIIMFVNDIQTLSSTPEKLGEQVNCFEETR